MADLLEFKFIFLDSLRIGPHKTARMFHDDVPVSNERITDREEPQIVKWILRNQNCRELFLLEVPISTNSWRDSIPDSQFPQSIKRQGGDVDLVCLENDNPHHAVCIEFKKVKVRIDQNGEERVNNLGKLEDLIEQGNRRQSEGFYKTYICAVAVIDSHEFKTPNVFVRGGNSNKINRFYNLKNIGNVHPDVGIILAEIVQPTGKSYKEMHGFGVCRINEAVALEQRSKLNDEVKIIFKHN